MGVTYRFNTQQYVAVMTRGIDKALVERMAVLGATIKELLSKPGKGRVYVRKSKGKSAYLGFNRSAYKDAMNSSGFRRLVVGKRFGDASALQGRFAYVTRSDAAAILRARRDRGVRNRSLRSLGFHKASAPGDPPAVDTGNLRRSWQVGFGGARPTTVGTKRVIRAGSSVKYARRLEYGGGAIAARPYIAPALARVGPTVRPAIAAAVAEALRAAGYSGWNVAGVSMAQRFRGAK